MQKYLLSEHRIQSVRDVIVLVVHLLLTQGDVHVRIRLEKTSFRVLERSDRFNSIMLEFQVMSLRSAVICTAVCTTQNFLHAKLSPTYRSKNSYEELVRH